MKTVANTNNMEFQKDVKKMTVGTTENFFHYLEINPNSTLYSIVWCVDQWVAKTDDKETVLPCTFSEQATKDG